MYNTNLVIVKMTYINKFIYISLRSLTHTQTTQNALKYQGQHGHCVTVAIRRINK